LKNTLHTRLKI